MEKGFLQASKGMIWAKKQKLTYLFLKEDEVCFGYYTTSVESYNCTDCKKIIVDYKDYKY